MRVTDFVSAAIFGYGYGETQTEFYAADATPGTDAPLITVTQTSGAITTVPIPPLEPATDYLWRSRYGGRLNASAPLIYSDWSSPRVFFLGAASLILTYDLDLATARTIHIPLGGGTVNTPLNVTIDWGDGSSEPFTTAGIKPHTYAEGAGPRVTVTITGRLDWYGTPQPIDQAGLVRVENIGFAMGLTSLRGAFRQTTTALEYITPNIPETVTSFEELFQESLCAADLRDMDTRNITTIRRIFYRSDGTGPNCANWDVGRVEDVFQAFADSQMNSSFSLGNWESLTSMEEMFVQTIGDYYGGRDGRVRFNQPIASWDVSRITSMRLMFGCTMRANAGKVGANFNQPIDAWDVRAVQSFEGFMGHLGNPGISQNTHAFNQPLSQWNTSAAINMTRMFALARSFNQDISGWNTANVTTMAGMFRGVAGVHGFNRSLNAWDVSNVIDMSEMFSFSDYNQPLAGWEEGGSTLGNVTDTSFMFNACPFNQPIGNWEVSSVTTFEAMFATGLTNTRTNYFDQDLSNWDVSSATTMRHMFGGLGRGSGQVQPFNNGGSPGINGWNVSAVINMFAMFGRGQNEGIISDFNQPIGDWDVSNVTDMRDMFDARISSHAFDQDISGWHLDPHVQLDGFMSDYQSDGAGRQFSEENYSRLLTGWSNWVAQNSGPFIVSTTFEGRSFNTTAYNPASRFTNAADGRAYLVAARALSVAAALDPDADGSYAFNAATGSYVNGNGWFFLKSGPTWTLFDDTSTEQATGDGNHAWEVEIWTGVLSGAAVLHTGTGWTITGDSPA